MTRVIISNIRCQGVCTGGNPVIMEKERVCVCGKGKAGGEMTKVLHFFIAKPTWRRTREGSLETRDWDR